MTLVIVFLIYFASVANGLKLLFGATGIVLLVFAFLLKLFKKLLGFGIISLILCALVPNERQVYYMSAAYLGGTTIETIANSPEMSKVRLIVNKKMDEYIKENNIQPAK